MSFVTTFEPASRELAERLDVFDGLGVACDLPSVRIDDEFIGHPPAPMTSAAPGYQSHALRLAWRNTPSLLLATPAMSIDADPRIRTVAAEAITDCHASAPVPEMPRMEVRGDRDLRRGAG